MIRIVAFVIVVAAIPLLMLFGENETIAGFAPEQLASLAALLAFGMVTGSWAFSHFSGRWKQGLQAMAFWTGALILLAAVYTYRYELQDGANMILSSFMPGYAVTTRKGEVITTKDQNRKFCLGRLGKRHKNALHL
jgi:aspartyl protease family protein